MSKGVTFDFASISDSLARQRKAIPEFVKACDLAGGRLVADEAPVMFHAERFVKEADALAAELEKQVECLRRVSALVWARTPKGATK